MFNAKELKMPETTKNDPFCPYLLVRFSKEQKDFLQKYSKRHGRSMSGQLVFIVEEIKKKYGEQYEDRTVS
jgi:hypothetical protein